MSIDDEDFRSQKRVFKALNSEIRLRLLYRMTEGPVAAPDVADEFDVTPETIVNNLNELEDTGFADSKEVRGPGGRPRKEFTLAGGGDGVRLELEVIEDEYYFEFDTADVRR
jgi:predicted ArsR family transcriptional regulator